jgi:hypothetical protein
MRITNSPDIFQAVMMDVLGDLEYVRTYLHWRHPHNIVGQLRGPPRKAPRGFTAAWNYRFQS